MRTEYANPKYQSKRERPNPQRVEKDKNRGRQLLQNTRYQEEEGVLLENLESEVVYVYKQGR